MFTPYNWKLYLSTKILSDKGRKLKFKLCLYYLHISGKSQVPVKTMTIMQGVGN